MSYFQSSSAKTLNLLFQFFALCVLFFRLFTFLKINKLLLYPRCWKYVDYFVKWYCFFLVIRSFFYLTAVTTFTRDFCLYLLLDFIFIQPIHQISRKYTSLIRLLLIRHRISKYIYLNFRNFFFETWIFRLRIPDAKHKRFILIYIYIFKVNSMK